MGEAFDFSSWEKPELKPEPKEPKEGEGIVVLSEAISIASGYARNENNPIAGFAGGKKPMAENPIDGFTDLFVGKEDPKISGEENELKKAA